METTAPVAELSPPRRLGRVKGLPSTVKKLIADVAGQTPERVAKWLRQYGDLTRIRGVKPEHADRVADWLTARGHTPPAFDLAAAQRRVAEARAGVLAARAVLRDAEAEERRAQEYLQRNLDESDLPLFAAEGVSA